MEPDYMSYTYDELLDVYHSIDKNLHPIRFQRVEMLLQEKSTISNTTENNSNIDTDKIGINSIEAIFKETEPQYGYIRFFIYVVVLSFTALLLRETSASSIVKFLVYLGVFLLNSLVWYLIYLRRLSNFKNLRCNQITNK